MADGYSPWNEASRSVSGLGGTLNQVALGLAQQRYREQLLQQQMALRQMQLMQQQQLNQAHVGLYNKQGALYEAQRVLEEQKAKDAARKATAGGVLGDVLEQLANPIPNMQPGTEQMLRGMVANQAGRLSAAGESRIPENIAQILGLGSEPLRNIMAAGGVGKLYQNVPQGTTAFPALPGMPMLQGGFTLNPGEQRFAPVQGAGPVGGPIATATGTPRSDMSLERQLATEQAVVRALMNAGALGSEVPQPGDDKFPQFQSATNRVALIQSALDAKNAYRIPAAPTNAPVAAPQAGTPQAKVALARQLRQEHPDWTKNQILQEVNRRMP